MVKHLLTSRRFAPLFLTQLLAALNDNFLKQTLVLLCLFTVGGSRGAVLGTMAGAVLIAPFFILSALAGEVADKYDKATLARRYKFAEIVAAAFAAAGYAYQSVTLLMLALGFYGAISALFGPIKYGLLPDQLTTEELSGGNALIESGTFLAILAGPVAAGWAAARDESPVVVVCLLMGISVACWLSARAIPSAPSSAPELVITRNPWRSTLDLLRSTRRDKRIWDGTLIVSWFWLAGAVTLALLAPVVTQTIGGAENVNTLCMLDFACGVGVGSIAAARLSRDRPNLALTPLGGALMAACCLALAASLPHVIRGDHVQWSAFAASPAGATLLLEFFGVAVGGGLFVVPSFAAVQAWAAPQRRARVVAANNVMAAAYMAGASVLVAGLQAGGIGNPTLFALLGLSNCIATFLVFRTWRSESTREFSRLCSRLPLRVGLQGKDETPPSAR